jgi:tetratricopeptide (TPR) repeat protein
MMNSLEVSKVSSQTILKADPELVRESNIFMDKGKNLLAEKSYTEALKLFTKALKINNSNYEAMFYKGMTYLDNGDPSKAVKELANVIQKMPNFKNTVYLVLSIAYMRDNDIMAALKVLTKAIKKYPKFIEAYLARGQIYTILNLSYENNFKNFNKGGQNNSIFKTLSIGQINDRIISDFQSVINLMPNKGMGYVGKGDALKGIGNYAGALE